MEPIPETVEAVRELDPAGDPELIASLVRVATRARELVPDLVGVSISMLAEDITFTLLATADEIAVLDAVQHVAGGEDAGGTRPPEVREHEDGVLDESRWQRLAESTAARPVRSTLTLPVLREGRAQGTVNLYAASRRAFVGHHDDLAAVFGAFAGGAIANADLSFTTRADARAAPLRVRERALVDVAAEILAGDLGVDLDTAAERLRDAAARAGVTEAQLADEIVRGREDADPDES